MNQIDKNPKFGHKLDFLAEMTDHFAANQPQKSVLVGDLDIALWRRMFGPHAS